MTALFFSEVLYYFISRIKNYIRLIIVVLVSIFGTIATMILPFKLPFALDTACVGVGLMHIGSLIKIYKQNKIINKILNMNIWWTLGAILVTILLIRVNSYVNMRKGEYGIIPLFWINAVLASLVVLIISKYMDKYLQKYLKKYIVGIGKDSITYLCLNQVVILVIYKVLQSITSILNLTSTITLIVTKLVELILVMLVLWICNLIIQKTKLRLLVGK